MKNLSEKTNLSLLSKKLGIPIPQLKSILDGTATVKAPGFLKKNLSNIQQKITTMVPKQTAMQKITAAEDASELWSILSTLSYDQPEYIVCYEKLVSFVEEETKSNDIDDLESLLRNTPSGSLQIKMLIDKITQLELNEVNKENDFYNLIEIYENRNFYSVSHQKLVDKIISKANDPEDVDHLLENVFNVDSLEYYTVKQRHSEIVMKAIADLRSLNSIESISDYIYIGSEEEITLAKKVVELGRDADEILGTYDSFDEGTEAREILAIGAIEKFTDYEQHGDDLQVLIDDWAEGSRVSRIATAKKHELLLKHVTKVLSVDDLKELLDDFGDGDSLKKKLIEKIVELTNDLDDLQELINNYNGYMSDLAEDKLNSILLEKAKGYTLNSNENYDDYADEDSDEESALDLSLVGSCNSINDADSVNDKIRGNSYAEYLLAKKFGGASPVKDTAPIVEPQPSVTEALDTKDQEQERIDTEIADRIKFTSSFDVLMGIYNSPSSSESNKELAYNKASKILEGKVDYIRSEQELIVLFNAFPKETPGSNKIIQKLAESYTKPWYIFW